MASSQKIRPCQCTAIELFCQFGTVVVVPNNSISPCVASFHLALYCHYFLYCFNCHYITHYLFLLCSHCYMYASVVLCVCVRVFLIAIGKTPLCRTLAFHETLSLINNNCHLVEGSTGFLNSS